VFECLSKLIERKFHEALRREQQLLRGKKIKKEKNLILSREPDVGEPHHVAGRLERALS